MKLATLAIGNDVIEAHNNMWSGVETVYFNGEQVSSQFNWFHGIHKFSVLAEDGFDYDHYRVDFRFSFSSASAVTVDIFKNGICVLDQSGTNHRYTGAIPPVRRQESLPADTLELRELAAQPLYREEDLV